MSFKKQYYLKESLYKNVYRGFATNDPTISLETVGKGTPDIGPGIYFTDSLEDAKKYGKYVLTVNISLTKTVSLYKAPSPKDLEVLIESSPKRDKALEQFGEDKDTAMDNAIKTFQDYKNEKDAFLALYNSFYYPVYARQYCIVMIRLGFDGMVIPLRDGSKQIVVYNVKTVSKVDFG